MLTAQDVLSFWFTECTPADWFGGPPEFDAKLAARFTETHRHVALGEASGWRTGAEGRLAEIIVLDQFSRQLHRHSPKAFVSDTMALALAQELVAHRLDLALTNDQRMFAYMPFMHSESLVIHDESRRLFSALPGPDNLKFETAHRDLLLRFGRYPKRNATLGRVSTPEEIAYIAAAGEGDI